MKWRFVCFSAQTPSAYCICSEQRTSLFLFFFLNIFILHFFFHYCAVEFVIPLYQIRDNSVLKFAALIEKKKSALLKYVYIFVSFCQHLIISVILLNMSKGLCKKQQLHTACNRICVDIKVCSPRAFCFFPLPSFQNNPAFTMLEIIIVLTRQWMKESYPEIFSFFYLFLLRCFICNFL